jgi:hypothetical protein
LSDCCAALSLFSVDWLLALAICAAFAAALALACACISD